MMCFCCLWVLLERLRFLRSVIHKSELAQDVSPCNGNMVDNRTFQMKFDFEFLFRLLFLFERTNIGMQLNMFSLVLMMGYAAASISGQ